MKFFWWTCRSLIVTSLLMGSVPAIAQYNTSDVSGGGGGGNGPNVSDNTGGNTGGNGGNGPNTSDNTGGNNGENGGDGPNTSDNTGGNNGGNGGNGPNTSDNTGGNNGGNGPNASDATGSEVSDTSDAADTGATESVQRTPQQLANDIGTAYQICEGGGDCSTLYELLEQADELLKSHQ